MSEVETVVGNEAAKIYWNYAFPTIQPLAAHKPDIVLEIHESRQFILIEFSSPADKNILVKEQEKKDKYQDLMKDLKRQHPRHSVRLVVLVIGAMGGMSSAYIPNLKSIPACETHALALAGRMQKAVILGSLRLLRSHDPTMS